MVIIKRISTRQLLVKFLTYVFGLNKFLLVGGCGAAGNENHIIDLVAPFLKDISSAPSFINAKLVLTYEKDANFNDIGSVQQSSCNYHVAAHKWFMGHYENGMTLDLQVEFVRHSPAFNQARAEFVDTFFNQYGPTIKQLCLSVWSTGVEPYLIMKSENHHNVYTINSLEKDILEKCRSLWNLEME